MKIRYLRLTLLLVLFQIGCGAQPAVVEITQTQPAIDILTATATATRPPTVSPTRTAPTLPPPTVTTTAFAPTDLRYLERAFDEVLSDFDGLAGYIVVDLIGGQMIEQNGEVAVSGMSMVKIPILLEMFRVLDEAPSLAQTTLITETATLSGNYTANLLLAEIAGQPDGGLEAAFAGAAQVTQQLRYLDLYDTFIAVPYDAEPQPNYFPTYTTLANQRTDLTTNPDSSMQTTAGDMATLLGMIYQCSQGEGRLLAAYQGQVTAAECRALLEVMAQNDIDAFLEAGVPAGVPVAHKHGWVGETHGDAGVILAEKRPYVMVIVLHRPGWLEWAESTVIIEELSRLAYAHFTDAAAYEPDLLATPLPPLPEPTATPGWPQARVRGTAGAGLTLRETPSGTQLLILPEGMRVYLLPEEQGAWRQVQLPNGSKGWVVAEFLDG